MTVVLDYGMGNIGSILNMLKHLGAEATSSNRPDQLRSASRLILPGVGAFDEGMTRLRQLDLLPALHELALEKKTPVLGICLGLQLMTLSSEEGKLPGLGWFQARTVAFDTQIPRIPHIGWNQAHFQTQSTYSPSQETGRFYFLHSYHVNEASAPRADVLATTHYGSSTFASALQRNNLVGVQFHPEKSHTCGKTLFRAFLEHA